jgi:hypothetical protein
LVKPRVLLRLRSGLKRLDPRTRAVEEAVPADRAWHEMLQRLDAEEAERRVDAIARELDAALDR